MEITININDFQLETIVKRSEEKLAKKEPEMNVKTVEYYKKYIELLENSVEDEEVLKEISNTFVNYVEALRKTHTKIGVQAGIDIASGKVEIW